MSPLRALARVNVAAIERNVARLRGELRAGSELCAVVKADGYGHGAPAAARAALAGGATWLAVATADEATQLRAAGVEAPLVLAGRPGWGAGDALARLRREPGVEVRLDPDDQALAALYGDALAVLYPSAQEGFGLPVAEAMAAGRPVVASDLDAIREWAGDVPWYVPPDDPGRLSKAIVALLASPDRAAARAAKGTEVAAGLSWTAAGEHIAAVLERAVSGR